ncbi:HEAT repeat domain-containing protein [Flagellimonas beolgyonensis]|uniref:HEAT repeat domain-containing protein n=1 Tax=Flagellimonas beolgyonensis TaxID=864064 RepID=UPI003D65C68D
MKNKHIDELIPDYLDGSLKGEDLRKMEQHLAECPHCQKELEEMKQLFNAFGDDQIEVPSERLKAQFEKVLETEKSNRGQVVQLQAQRKENNWSNTFLKVAASIALLVASFQMGSVFQQRKADKDIALLQEETLQMKQTAMLSLMENQSASKRIQGVSYIEEFESPDEAIIKALGNRLLYDENDNVRMSAFEALAKFTSSESVKNILIEALEKEKNPSIQVAIIQALVQIQEKKAVKPMQKLLDQEDTQPFIKEQIKAVLPSIT